MGKFEIMMKPWWMFLFYELELDLKVPSMDQLVLFKQYLHCDLSDGKFAEVDSALEKLDASRIHPSFVVALLRMSSQVRDRLPHWPEALEKLKAELQRRGLPPTILAGLDP